MIGLAPGTRVNKNAAQTPTGPLPALRQTPPGVEVAEIDKDEVIITTEEKSFRLWWHDDSDYRVSVENGRVSPSYGKVIEIKKLVLTCTGSLRPLSVYISPVVNGRNFESSVSDRLSQK